eukprot:5380174-Amphidinium_carterae.1
MSERSVHCALILRTSGKTHAFMCREPVAIGMAYADVVSLGTSPPPTVRRLASSRESQWEGAVMHG